MSSTITKLSLFLLFLSVVTSVHNLKSSKSLKSAKLETSKCSQVRSPQWFDCMLRTDIPGADIADDAISYPDPFAFYISSIPGVTLIGPDRSAKCGWKVGTNFVWDPKWNTCILNGGGYPIESSTALCKNGKYSSAVNPDSYVTVFNKFQDYALNKAEKVLNSDGSIKYMTSFVLEGKPIKAAMSLGHGVLDGLCGDCFIIEQNGKYVALLQTDVRAWSLELSSGANIHLAEDNYGGTCYIPKVAKVCCSAFMQ